MMKLFRKVREDEDGAVTVDWVVLTAAVVGMGLGVVAIMRSGPTNIGNSISSTLASSITVATQ
ncbi:Flp family type IVb pilin [Frigidibacter sp. ROC022]|uniref:Flp family type IVb pilin n=1 Tax=Frigidibacter sp. ROC022 TaxID=2971796 RepID=UPI00215B344D|nr:hypothetical protein [Frigidibacter sp. ROC022]MCR8723655.1 hypothetical protein [Frigidibacter sp. ROC022]